MKKDIETLAQESAHATAVYNNLSAEVEALLHTSYIQGYQAANDFDSTAMTFGQAIDCLKQGYLVARKGWNGKGMFLWLKPAAVVKAEWCKDPLLKSLAEANGGEIQALGTVCMYTANKEIVSGWLASQADILSEDWMIVER